MRKVFTTLCLALVAMGAHAVEIWSGSVTLSNYTRSEEVILPAEPFVNAAVGDKLIVHFTEYTADPQTWHQVEIWTWIAEENAMGEALTTPGYHISPGDTECTFIITEPMLVSLKEGNAAMAGTGYVLTSIDYESNADSDGTLWEGESVFTSWVPSVQVLIPASYFVTAKEGDLLVYTVKCNNKDAWAAIRAEAGDWSGGIGDSDHVISSTNYEDVIVTLDKNLLEQVQAKGIVMVGDNVTLSRVSLRSGQGQQGTADYGVIWEGTLTFDNWTPSADVALTGDVFEGLVPGDKLIVSAQKTNPGEWGAFRLEGGDTWAALVDQEYYELNGEGVLKTEVVMTSALIDDLKAHGLRFSGTNITISCLELVSGYEESSVYGTLWEGSVSFPSWSPTGDLSVVAAKFADARVGDLIVVTASKMTDGVWAALRVEGADWCGALAEQEYIELKDGGEQEISIVISQALLADLQAHGMRFSGDNMTVTKVALAEGDAPEPSGALWEGTLTFADWSPSIDVCIKADQFANAKVGDLIVLTVQKPDAEAWGAIRLEGGDWCGALAGQEYLEAVGGDVQELGVVVTEALLADLLAHGLRFSGTNLVLTKVVLTDDTAIHAVSAEPADGILYDLSGRTLDAPRGIYILNGKKMLAR